MKCSECDGKGFTSLGEGVRGVKKCVACRGRGELVARCLECGKQATIDAENSIDSRTVYKTICETCGGKASLIY